jgi:peroxiredoxin
MKSRLSQGVVLTVLLGFLLSCAGHEGEKVKIGRTAPNFQYQDISGNKGSIEELRGKLILLRFWANWCPYCKFEMPRIDRFYQLFRNQGFEVIAVNVGDSVGIVEAFTAEMNLHFPMILDPEGKLAQSYGVKGIPTNFLLDRQGMIREIIVGEVFTNDQVLWDLFKPYFSKAS